MPRRMVVKKTAKAGRRKRQPASAPAARRAAKMRPARVETAASDRAAASPPQPLEDIKTTVRTREGPAFSVTSSKHLQRAAIQWSYVLRNRRRWAAQESVREEQSRRAIKLFEDLGVSLGALERLAESEVVEVSIPFEQEAMGWEARIFPWEYMLTAATQGFRAGRPMIVVRHLDRRGAGARRRAGPQKVLYVESAPSTLSEVFSFESERALVKTALGLGQHRDLLNPTAEVLRKEVAAFAPDVIHLAGSDSHQAAQLLDALKEFGE
ncbi:MAG TPA: hypothetical protein VNO14_10085, partial [Blastocatellia bacterium]|nr:hypothetical protein [Blastocatellia bacterium]